MLSHSYFPIESRIYLFGFFVMKVQDIYTTALHIIRWFPKTTTWKPYLTMHDWTKIFFDIFVHKYGLYWNITRYTTSDVVRRIRLVEFFEYIIHNFTLWEQQDTWKYSIETAFYKMIIAKKYDAKNRRRYVVISFYQK